MAKFKVCLDAGHYGKYNTSPANRAYYESDMTWKLHLLQKKYLEKYEDVEVILTRADQDRDLSVYNRGTKSKGCDLFLSDHSNALSGSVNEVTDYPVVIVQLNGKGDELGRKLAACIAAVMGTRQEGRIYNRRGNSGEYYGVLRGAEAVGTVGMILEHSFHTHTRSTNWLLKDSNLDALARAEVEVIAAHYGLKKKNGAKVTKNAWIEENGRWWYRHADGTCTKNGWERIEGIWYLFDEKGWMLTGWQQRKGVWYYLLANGKMATGWVEVNGHWYHLGENGVMDTGLFWDTDGRLYYLAADGHMCRTNGSGALM